MDIAVPRQRIVNPTELTRLASKREPDSLGHLWKYTSSGQDQGRDLGNNTSQISAALSKLNARPWLTPSGYYPFKIYQLPPQFRSSPSPNDYLKFRCRNGLVTFRPINVADDMGPFDGNPWFPMCQQCGYANAPDPTQLGVPTSLYAQLGQLPFVDNNEVFLVNGGDPDYILFGPDQDPDVWFSFAYFWASLDASTIAESGQPAVINIHFGGFYYKGGDYIPFGDEMPFDGTYTNHPGGPGFYTPVFPGLMTNYFFIGTIFMLFQQGYIASGNVGFVGKPYITNYVNWHQTLIPTNYGCMAGDYSDSIIYYTGDLVNGYASDQGVSSGDPYVYLWVQSYAYANGDDGDPVVDLRNTQQLGIWGQAPPAEASGDFYWMPYSWAIAP